MKLVKFIKENKVIVFALIVVLLTFVLFALPGQFAHYGKDTLNKKGNGFTYLYNLNGYQWIFATVKNAASSKIGHVTGYGIIVFSLLVLSVPGLLFSKKSSFVALLTTLALIVVAILLFSISKASLKAYPDFVRAAKTDNPKFYNINWVPYVSASFLMISGLCMAYRTLGVMKSEMKKPTQSKGPSYNYLHK